MRKLLSGVAVLAVGIGVALAAPPAAANAAGGTSTWTGGGGNVNLSTPGNWDTVPTAGSDLSFPVGAGSGASPIINDFPAGTAFGRISTGGSLWLQGNAAAPSELATTSSTAQLYVSAPLITASSLTTSGPAGSYIHTLSPISGAGSLVLNGPGNVYIYGANTITGPTTINAGYVLTVSARAALADVTVAAGATLSNSGGPVGALVVNGRTVNSPTVTHAATSLSFGATASLSASAQAPSGSTLRMNVAGDIDLAGTLTVSNRWAPAVGQSTTILATTGGVVRGQFTGIPDGGLVMGAASGTFPAVPYRVHYTATAVTLTAVNATTTSLDALTSPVAVDAATTFTARTTSAGGSPTGTVEFLAGSTPLGSAQLTGGVASFTTSFASSGSRQISARYLGDDADFATSTSAAATLSVLVPPSLVGATTAAATAGVAFAYAPTAGGGSPRTFSSSELPEGLAISASTGRISGTATALGVFPVTITATNPVGSATLSVTITVAPGPLASIVVSPIGGTVTAGGSLMFSAEGFDSRGYSRGDLTSLATFRSSSAGDTVTGSTIRFSQTGTSTITATVGAVRGTTSVSVTVGAPARLVVAPSTTTVVAGDSVTFTVEGFDAEGNSLGAQRATLRTDDPSDVVTDDTIRFTTAGRHAITATVGLLSVQTVSDVQVDPTDVATLTLRLSATTAHVRDTITATVTARDSFGNDLGDVTADATLTSDNPADTVRGATVMFGHASIHVITATLNGRSASVAVTVVDDAEAGTADVGSSALVTTGADAAPTLYGALALLLLGVALLASRVRMRRGRRLS
jgi:autotransporter-associated beta strand protein